MQLRKDEVLITPEMVRGLHVYRRRQEVKLTLRGGGEVMIIGFAYAPHTGRQRATNDGVRLRAVLAALGGGGLRLCKRAGQRYDIAFHMTQEELRRETA